MRARKQKFIFRCHRARSDVLRARSSTHRSLREFLDEPKSEFGDVLYHAEVRWLSHGRKLELFFTQRDEIQALAREKGTFPDGLADPKFWQQIALLTDIMLHMNELNTKLQGEQNSYLISILK